MYEYERIVQDNGGMTSRNNNREYVNVFVAKCLFMYIHKKTDMEKTDIGRKILHFIKFFKN